MFKQYLHGLLCLVVCFCMSISLNAQSLVQVVDITTNLPIENVSITEEWNDPQTGKKNNYIGTTNASGGYELHPELIQNKGTVTISHTQFQTTVLTAYQLIEGSYSVKLTPSAVLINDIVISANKFEEPKKDVPRQIETISKQEVRFANQQTTADLLQNSGYVFVQKSQMGGGSPVMRGFEANKTLIVVDGIRMNNAIYRGGHLQNVLRIDQNMLERTELFFGPGSVIYGSDALGGVMHFTSLSPTVAKADTVEVSNHFYMRYGTVNREATTHYDINIGLKKWAFLTSISASSFGDLKQGKNRNSNMGDLGLRDSVQVRVNGKDVAVKNDDNAVQLPTAYKQIDLMQKVLFKQSPTIEHMLNLQLSTSTDVPRYDRLTELKDTTFSSAEWYYGPELRTLAAYHLKLKGATNLYDEARLVFAYQYIEESRHNRNYGSNSLNHRNEFVHVATANADFMKRIRKNELRYGAEFTYNSVQSNANKENIVTGAYASQSTRYPDGGSSMSSFAAYVSHSVELNEHFVLTEGLRYNLVQLDANFIDKSFYSFLPDNFHQKNQAVNGQVGLVFLPGSDWKLSTAFSTGFRAPNVDDVGKIFDSQSGEQAIIPNPDLKPENSYNIDLGIGKVFYKKVKLEVNGFYTIVNQLISSQHTTVNGSDSIEYNGQNTYVMQMQNTERAYIYGGSATLAADVTKHISLVNTFNFTYGRMQTDSTDYPLDHIPPVFGRSAVNVAVKNIQSEFFVLYNGWKHIKDYNLMGEDNEQYATKDGIPAWYTLNLRVSYNYLASKDMLLQFQLGCENILDYNYRNFASGVSAPGRNFYATVRASF